MKKLFALSLLAFVGTATAVPSFTHQLSASDEVAATSISNAHQNDGYDIEVGQEVELKQEQFTFLPENASKSIKYKLAGDSYEGDLPPAMFSTSSTYSNIIIKGLMVGDFKVYFFAGESSEVFTYTTFHVYATDGLPNNAQVDGIEEVKSAAQNGVLPGTTSLYENKQNDGVEKPTPLFNSEGRFTPSAIPTFISQFFSLDAFVILGIVLIGLLFIYILLYSIKKAIWKHRR